MAPLSKSTMSMRFMQRGQPGGDTQPTPAIQKARVKRTVPSTAPVEPVASTSKVVVEEREQPLPMMGRKGPIIRREASILGFPILSSINGGASAGATAGPPMGRRSFGHFNKAVESLHKPAVTNIPSAAKGTASQSSESESSSEEDSDSSLEMLEAPPPAPTGRKRPPLDASQSAGPPPSGFLKPMLGEDHSPKKKKRRKD